MNTNRPKTLRRAMIFHLLLDDTQDHGFVVAHTREHIAKRAGMTEIVDYELTSLMGQALIVANGPIEDPETRYSLHPSVEWKVVP